MQKKKQLDQYQSTFPPAQVQVYQTDEGLKKSYELEGNTHWLSVGEKKAIFFNEKRKAYLAFDVFEAEKYGFKIICEDKNFIPGYPNLHCHPKHLLEQELLDELYAIGYEYTLKKYLCPACQKQWVIERTYDSMKGVYRTCKLVE